MQIVKPAIDNWYALYSKCAIKLENNLRVEGPLIGRIWGAIGNSPSFHLMKYLHFGLPEGLREHKKPRTTLVLNKLSLREDWNHCLVTLSFFYLAFVIS